MPASASFLTTALAAVRLTPEYAAFQTALAALSAAGEESKLARWKDAYDDGRNTAGSPALRLRRACRDAVANAQVASSGATPLSQPDAEAAYEHLVAQVAPYSTPPVLATPWTPALTAEDVDLIRMAAARLAGD